MTNPYKDFDPDAEAESIAAPAPEPIDTDRGEPTTKAPKKRKSGVVLLIVAIIIGSLIAVGFFAMFLLRATSKSSPELENIQADQAITRQSSSGPDLGAFQNRVEQQLADQRAREERQRREALATAGGSQAAPNAPDAPSAAPSLGNYQGRSNTASTTSRGSRNKEDLTPEEVAKLRRYQPGVLWGDIADTGQTETVQPRRQGGGGSTASGDNPPTIRSTSLTGGGADSIGSMLRTEAMADGYAYVRPDLKFLLINGTTIPCTLIPRIVTNYPGHTSCLVNRDVYSADGSVVLIERGSRVTGERRVSIQPGDAKVFVAWSSIETPDGVKVGIDSMAADQLGAAGLDAWINNHYAKRFGGAILLSFLDDAFQYIAEENRRGDGIRFDSSTNNAEDMASIALENSINIPPTGYVQHATETNIIVARDIDFRHVYEVR